MERSRKSTQIVWEAPPKMKAKGHSFLYRYTILSKYTHSRELIYPIWEKENNLQKCLGRGYVSSQEGKDSKIPLVSYYTKLINHFKGTRMNDE